MTIRYFALPHSEAVHGLLALPTPHGRWQPRYLLPYREPHPPRTGRFCDQVLEIVCPIAKPAPTPKSPPTIPPIPPPSATSSSAPPQGVQETIYLLQAHHYVDHAQWSGSIAIGEDGIRITRQEGQVMAYLMRRR